MGSKLSRLNFATILNFPKHPINNHGCYSYLSFPVEIRSLCTHHCHAPPSLLGSQECTQRWRIDMLLLDDQSSLIQASISVHRLNTFRALLREGAMYELSGFDVSRSKNNFKICDSVVAIRFTDSTKMVEVPAVASPIPTEMFRFRNVDQLMSLANTNVQLPDVIGEICDIKATYNDHTQTTQRLMINIRVAKEATVCASVFDNLAEKLDKRLAAAVVHPTVMIATNINPKNVGGRLYLNATSGTHFYFDNDVSASQTLFDELNTKAPKDITTGKQYHGVKKLEQVMLGELNNYVLESPPQLSIRSS